MLDGSDLLRDDAFRLSSNDDGARIYSGKATGPISQSGLSETWRKVPSCSRLGRKFEGAAQTGEPPFCRPQLLTVSTRLRAEE